MAKAISGQHGKKHPVNWLAIELGVDRNTLAKRLGTGTFTIREAYEAITSKSEREADRDRRMKAEAKSAEIDAAEKEKKLMLRVEHETVVRELAVQTRAKVQAADYIEKASRQKLTRELAGIKVKL